MLRRALVLAAAGLLGCGLAAAQPARSGHLVTGRAFPHLSFPDLQTGELRSLSAWRGKRVVLHVFASW